MMDTNDNCTALLYSCKNDCTEAVEALLQCGATSDVCDANDITPLMWSARKHNETVMKALIRAGADVNYRNKKVIRCYTCPLSHIIVCVCGCVCVRSWESLHFTHLL